VPGQQALPVHPSFLRETAILLEIRRNIGLLPGLLLEICSAPNARSAGMNGGSQGNQHGWHRALPVTN